MFDNLKIGYYAWQLLNGLKEGTMDTGLILQLAQLLIPIIVPLEIAAVKRLAPLLPSWLLPILAPILGGFQAGITGISSVGAGAVLGAAGVGVREITDQVRKITTNAQPN